MPPLPTAVDLLMSWVEKQLGDEALFPDSGAYPAQFLAVVKKIWTRLFRVYAHGALRV